MENIECSNTQCSNHDPEEHGNCIKYFERNFNDCNEYIFHKITKKSHLRNCKRTKCPHFDIQHIQNCSIPRISSTDQSKSCADFKFFSDKNNNTNMNLIAKLEKTGLSNSSLNTRISELNKTINSLHKENDELKTKLIIEAKKNTTSINYEINIRQNKLKSDSNKKDINLILEDRVELKGRIIRLEKIINNLGKAFKIPEN